MTPQLDERIVTTSSAMKRAFVIDETANAGVERDDFHAGLSDGVSERDGREDMRVRCKRDRHSLITLTDRNRGDAFQAPAQRHFHGRCARGSRDATDVGDHHVIAVAGF